MTPTRSRFSASGEGSAATPCTLKFREIAAAKSITIQADFKPLIESTATEGELRSRCCNMGETGEGWSTRSNVGGKTIEVYADEFRNRAGFSLHRCVSNVLSKVCVRIQAIAAR